MWELDSSDSDRDQSRTFVKTIMDLWVL